MQSSRKYVAHGVTLLAIYLQEETMCQDLSPLLVLVSQEEEYSLARG